MTIFSNNQPSTLRSICLLIGAIAIMSGSIFNSGLNAQEGDAAATTEESSAGGEVDLGEVSYVIGVNIGRNMENAKIDLDFEMFNKGLKDAVGGGEIAMTDEQMGAVLEAFGTYQQEKEAAAKLAFLDENKKEEGVKVTDSGLQYRVIKAGDKSGKQPGATDSVTVHYTGTLTDGTVFDSSVERGEPAVFNANQVIKGWTEALQLMHEGDKWEIVLPSELAYGKAGTGRGGPIGPDEVLVFEVELIKINGGTEDEESDEK